MTASAEPVVTAAGGRPFEPLPRAERERLLGTVDGILKMLVGRFRVPKREWDDVHQELRMSLWVASEKFDPARGVKWSTYATQVATNALLGLTTGRCDLESMTTELSEAELIPDRSEPVALDDGPPDDADEPVFADLHREVRRQLHAGKLDTLSPGLRRLVEQVVIDGLNPDQIAIQNGYTGGRKVVLTNLQAAIAKLRGHKVELGELRPPSKYPTRKDRPTNRRDRPPAASQDRPATSLPLPSPAPDGAAVDAVAAV